MVVCARVIKGNDVKEKIVVKNEIKWMLKPFCPKHFYRTNEVNHNCFVLVQVQHIFLQIEFVISAPVQSAQQIPQNV